MAPAPVKAGQPAAIGSSEVRIDGRLKVTGAAVFASDELVRGPAYAVPITSAIARGRITGIRLDLAKAVRGCLDILTYENVGNQVKPPTPQTGGGVTTTMENDRIWHDGQIIGLVVAETLEAAREAASKVQVDYAAEDPSATFDSPGAEEKALSEIDAQHKDPKVGDAEGAFTAAATRIDQRYSTPTQHHNPMELFTTTAEWRDDKLTLYEPSQFLQGLKTNVAKQIGADPSNVRAVSRFIGGAFGSRGATTGRTAWVALAAKRLNRPVKLEPTRMDGFTIATYRAETRHHVKLAAGPDGKLEALVHEGWEVTSRPSTYNVSGVATTARIYACPNILTKVSIVHADRNTPGFMRAPPETPYLFPLESAMDELAHELKIDPIELRRINDTMIEPIGNLPFTSRHLMECYDAGAKMFDWSRRKPAPGALRDGEWLVGLGCATACYPASIGAATARVTLTPPGKARVQLAAQEIGNGALTIIAITAADRLGLSIDDISVEAGDSDLPAAGLAAGSTHAATTCNVVAKACEMIRDKLARTAAGEEASSLGGRDPAMMKLVNRQLVEPSGRKEDLARALERAGGLVEAYAENIPDGAPPNSIQMLYQGQPAMARGSEQKKDVRYSFGAQFIEVGVHERTREVRVRRAVGAFAAGQIMNPLTARSQLMGGMIWGISAALLEQTEIDLKSARYYNDDLAEYLIPVNADIPEVDVIMMPETDEKVNALGIKGVGELGTTGMNAAVANAVFNAVGVRVRDLPIRIEKLIA